MGVVVHGEVGEPGAGVGVHHDLVSALHVDDDVLPSHRVLVVVLVVLVENRSKLFSIFSYGQQSLLVIVGGNVEDKEVEAVTGGSEDSRLNIHSFTNIA